MNKIKILAVTGPTATGKTSLAVKLARKFSGEVISVDSRQVYKGLDIGSGKDIAEYGAGDNAVPYHLIDIADPALDEYNLKEFCRDAESAIKEINERGRLPILAGGTALYMNAFLKGYSLPGDAPEKKDRERLRKKTPEELRLLLKKLSPDALAKLKDPRNPYRIIRAIEKILYPGENEIPFSNKISPLLLGVYFHRKTVHSRIEERLLSRLDKGMEEEVRRLHENGVSWEKLDRFGLEYRYMSYFLKGEMSREEVREQLLFKIRGFAKSQDIWFRKMERKGTVIHWIKKGDFDKATRIVRLFLEDKPLPPPEIRMMDIHYGPKDRN